MFRQALGCPIFLCLWHGTKAWLEQLRRKLVNKERIREAFQALYGIMFLRAAGSREERLAAVNAKIAAFKSAFAEERAMVAWFEREWEKKKGALVCQHTTLCRSAA